MRKQPLGHNPSTPVKEALEPYEKGRGALYNNLKTHRGFGPESEIYRSSSLSVRPRLFHPRQPHTETKQNDRRTSELATRSRTPSSVRLYDPSAWSGRGGGRAGIVGAVDGKTYQTTKNFKFQNLRLPPPPPTHLLSASSHHFL